MEGSTASDIFQRHRAVKHSKKICKPSSYTHPDKNFKAKPYSHSSNISTRSKSTRSSKSIKASSTPPASLGIESTEHETVVSDDRSAEQSVAGKDDNEELRDLHSLIHYQSIVLLGGICDKLSHLLWSLDSQVLVILNPSKCPPGLTELRGQIALTVGRINVTLGALKGAGGSRIGKVWFPVVRKNPELVAAIRAMFHTLDSFHAEFNRILSLPSRPKMLYGVQPQLVRVSDDMNTLLIAAKLPLSFLSHGAGTLWIEECKRVEGNLKILDWARFEGEILEAAREDPAKLPYLCYF